MRSFTSPFALSAAAGREAPAAASRLADDALAALVLVDDILNEFNGPLACYGEFVNGVALSGWPFPGGSHEPSPLKDGL